MNHKKELLRSLWVIRLCSIPVRDQALELRSGLEPTEPVGSLDLVRPKRGTTTETVGRLLRAACRVLGLGFRRFG